MKRHVITFLLTIFDPSTIYCLLVRLIIEYELVILFRKRFKPFHFLSIVAVVFRKNTNNYHVPRFPLKRIRIFVDL